MDHLLLLQVVELSVDKIAKSNNWIGSNFPRYENNDDDEESKDEDEEETPEEVPGMELKSKPKPIQKSIEPKNVTLTTKKDIKREIRKKATKTVQKSKAFQLKNKLERQKNKKKSSKMKNQRMKLHSKRAKHRGKRMVNE